MPDGMGGAGIGAGGGAIAAIVAYTLDKTLGSGRAVKSLDEKFAELKAWLEADIQSLTKIAERTARFTEKTFEMHDVADPDDPSGRIWYFSVGLRNNMKSLSERVSKLVDLIEKLVSRFDQYNQTMEKLIRVVEQLQKDVSALGVMISATSR